MAFPLAALGVAAGGSALSFLGGQQALGASQAQSGIQNLLATEQLNFEREAAQNGISWRVQDAKNAGISPLVALGAPTFNPGAIGVSGGNYDNPNAGAGAGLVSMGQDLSRAAMVAQTEKTRADSIAAVEAAKSNSALTQSQIELNKANTARAYATMSSSPAMPAVSGNWMAGQGNTPSTDMVRTDPSKSIAGASPFPASEAASTPGIKMVRQPDGGFDPQPSPSTSVGATGETTGWTLRNRFSPPEGYHTGWNLSWYPDKGSSWYDRPFQFPKWSGPDYRGGTSTPPY